MRARRHVIRISTVLAPLLTVPSALGAGGTAASAAETYSQPFQSADPTTWMPTYDTCRYLREWVAVKIRWQLSVDSTERSALQSTSSGCANSTITVTRAL